MMRNFSTSSSEYSSAGIRTRTVSTSFEEQAARDKNQKRQSSSRATLTSSDASMSFAGLLASKRLARRITSKYFGRSMNTFSSFRISATGSSTSREPTLQMEPKKKFCSVLVKNTLKSYLAERLEGFRYSSNICSKMCKILGDEIKEEVKSMHFDRYKIVTVVVIGEKRNQGAVIASEAAWDPAVDNFATYTYENKEMYCTAFVYGLYNE